MVRALVLVLLLGCHAGDPFECKTSDQCQLDTTAGTCEPSGFCSFADTACPSGRRYDASASAELAGMCVGVTDTDHDGVGDVDDNCPTTFNPMQENEDGDPYGDACDPCPPIKELMPPSDSDNDGVTDLCDPRTDPAKPDRIVLFEGFHHGVPTSWTLTQPWTTANDALQLTSGGAITFPLPASLGVTYLYAAVTITSEGAQGANLAVELAGVACGFEESAPQTNQKLVLRTASGQLMSVDTSFDTAHTYTFIEEWDRDAAPNFYGCYVTDGVNPPTMTGATFAQPTTDVGFVNGISARGALQYLMIVAQ